MSGRVLACGERAWLVEVDGLDAVLALNALVTRRMARGEGPWGRVVDVVPAASTLLVTTRSPADRAALRPALIALLTSGEAARPRNPEGTDEVRIGVRYDGPDLDEVSRTTGLTPAEVVAAHTGTPWRVAFGGFAPGFAYLVGGDPRLEVPRRPEPRTVVPSGAVGLAGRFSGVYPRPSPGGWQLIGRTDAVLFDPARTPPALLRPGAVVRFEEVGR